MIKKIPYFIFGLLFLALILFPFFAKVKVECLSQYGECPGDIESKLKVLNGKSLFAAKIEAPKLLRKDFFVSDFSSQYKLPNVLVINILIKKPMFSVLDKTSAKYLLVDDSGVVLAYSDSSGLSTLIKENAEAKIGEVISDKDLFALKLIQGVAQMYQVDEGMIQNDTLAVDLPGGLRVIFPLGGMDTQVLLGSLRLIYTKVTTDFPGTYSQIDMRYKNPILR